MKNPKKTTDLGGRDRRILRVNKGIMILTDLIDKIRDLVGDLRVMRMRDFFLYFLLKTCRVYAWPNFIF